MLTNRGKAPEPANLIDSIPHAGYGAYRRRVCASWHLLPNSPQTTGRLLRSKVILGISLRSKGAAWRNIGRTAKYIAAGAGMNVWPWHLGAHLANACGCRQR